MYRVILIKKKTLIFINYSVVMVLLFLLAFFLAPNFAEVKSKGIRAKMSMKNGMPGPAQHDKQAPVNYFRHDLSDPDRSMHFMQLDFFGDTLNTPSDGWWYWYKFCTFGMGMEIKNVKKKFAEAAKNFPNEIKKFTKYIDKKGNLSDTKSKGSKPVMTKSGMLVMLSKEGLWPSTPTYRQAARVLPRFMTKDESNIANGGAKAASASPMQQPCSPVQAPDEVLFSAHDMFLHHLS